MLWQFAMSHELKKIDFSRRDIRSRSCPNISGTYSTGHAKHPSCVNCMTAQCVYIRKEHYYAHSCSLLKDNIRKDSILHSIWTLKGNLKVLTMLYLGHTVHCLHNYYVHYVCSESTVVNACSTMLLLKYSISYTYKKAEPIHYRLRFEVAKIR